jgi:putative membrane-bound dehydrogenase-like protein
MVILLPLAVAAAPPEVRDPDLVLELIAKEPDIVTPTGIAVDQRGRIWCLENHTHQRGTDYKGPSSDRIRVFEDFGPDGRARKVWTFAEGFRDAMGLTFGPDGSLYLATRSTIYRLQIDGDREAGREVLVKLETQGTYPHNGLCGFAWDGHGNLIFGLGENLGEPYRLVGSDGATLTGGGEGGSMYRCQPDGSKLERLATRFWNPFAHCVDAQGRLFAVDNDPDARGPCRLLHVVPGGDYGYRFQYGRKGLHPFNAWNGELPGTLPMVAGTAEAPSGVLAADFTSLPSAYRGQLLVTSWGDHTIESFTLSPRGASFTAQSRIIVRGDEDFRPVALAAAPDGSVVFSDWVDRSYPVHGKGRIWRLRPRHLTRPPNRTAPITAKAWSEDEALRVALSVHSDPQRTDAIRALRQEASLLRVVELLGDSDPFIVSATITALGRRENASLLRRIAAQKSLTPTARRHLVVAIRQTNDPALRDELPRFLSDPDPSVRRTAIQWAAEEKIHGSRESIRQSAFRPPVTRELIEAWVKADEMLADARSANEESSYALIQRVVLNESLPDTVRAVALRMVAPDSPALSDDGLIRLARGASEELALEALRTLIFRIKPEHREVMQHGLLHPSTEIRRWSVLGLASYTDSADVVRQLLRLLEFDDLRIDALRSLRGVPSARPSIEKWWREYSRRQELSGVDRTDLAEQVQRALRIDAPMADASSQFPANWQRALERESGDPSSGERVFFHPQGPACAKCHRVGARGSAVGPDLTLIGRSVSREKLIESILDPNREVAPAFVSWEVVTHDGRQYVGLIPGETHDSMVILVDREGRIVRLPRREIEERRALRQSIMPQDISAKMTRREFLDLLAFLMQCK